MTNDNQHIPSGYKPSPLGIIPEDWEVKRLGEITTKIGSGITPRGGQNVYVTKGHPFMRSQNVGNGHLLLDDIVYIDASTHQKQISTEIACHDVLLNITGASIGRCAVAEKSIVGGNVNQHVCIIRLKNKDLSYYVCSFLLSYMGQKQVDSFQAGGNREGLNYDQISSFKICIPPLNEINQISTILSLWDTAIAKQTALIEQLTLHKRGLMQQLLTGKKRLKGFEGEWNYHRIEEHFEQVIKRNDGKGHVPMTISARLGLVSQKDKFDRVVAGNSLDNYTLLEKGDFAYNKGNSNLYEMGCIYRLAEESAVVPFVYICFRVKDDTSCEFYQHFFINHGLDKQLKQIITSGARGDGLLNVSSADFMSLKIPYPPIKEQQAIAVILNNADKEIEIQKQKLAAMQEQKKGLMQVLLTGKKRINE